MPDDRIKVKPSAKDGIISKVRKMQEFVLDAPSAVAEKIFQFEDASKNAAARAEYGKRLEKQGLPTLAQMTSAHNVQTALAHAQPSVTSAGGGRWVTSVTPETQDRVIAGLREMRRIAPVLHKTAFDKRAASDPSWADMLPISKKDLPFPAPANEREAEANRKELEIQKERALEKMRYWAEISDDELSEFLSRAYRSPGQAREITEEML